jgi:hypothetical protein
MHGRERRESRAAVLRRGSGGVVSSTSDDEVGGFHSAMRERPKIRGAVFGIPAAARDAAPT